MAYQYQFNPQNFQQQYQQIQQMFPQPQGSVYSINSPLEIGNVPIGSTGLSVAMCLSEDIMYIKSFQNGSPVIMAYSIKPYQKNHQDHQDDKTQPEQVTDNRQELFKDFDVRINKLEKAISELLQPKQQPAGGKFDGLV